MYFSILSLAFRRLSLSFAFSLLTCVVLTAQPCYDVVVSGDYVNFTTEWTIENGLGEELAFGVGGSTSSICLEDGCYTLYMNDTDGTDWQNGSITIEQEGNLIAGPFFLDSHSPNPKKFSLGTATCCYELDGNIGETCDDGNPNTVNDRITQDCECEGISASICEATNISCGDTLSNQTIEGSPTIQGSNCFSPDVNDSWYSFNVFEGETHTVQLLNSDTTITGLYYGESCESASLIEDCVEQRSYFSVSDPGKYFLRVRGVDESITYDVALSCVPTAVNDEICDALFVGEDETLAGQSFSGSTPSLQDLCDLEDNNDLWYELYNEDYGLMTVEVISDSDISIALHTETNECQSTNWLIAAGCDDTEEIIQHYQIGTTYLRVINRGEPNTEFDVNVTIDDIPENNEKCDAIELTCGDTLINQSALAATVSEFDECITTETGDVWYSFYADGGQIYYLEAISDSAITMMLYEGEDCTSTSTYIDCTNDEQVLTTGEEGLYFLKARPPSPEQDFDITLRCPPPPANDESCNAVNMACGDSLFNQSFENATNTNDNYCFGDQVDVWYKIEVPFGYTYRVEKSSQDETDITLYDGEDCSDLNIVDSNCGNEQNVVQAEEEGTYFISISANSTEVDTFSISMDCIEHPDNNTVCGATTLSCGDTLLNQGFYGATETYEDICDDENVDLWYTIEKPDDDLFYYITKSPDSDVSMSLFSGSNCDNYEALDTGCGISISNNSFEVTEPGTYYFNVRAEVENLDQFDVWISCVDTPDNDSICSALEVSCNDTIQGLSFMGHTPSYYGDCDGDADMWFTFEGLQDTSYIIEFDNDYPSLGLHVFEGSDCNSANGIMDCNLATDDSRTVSGPGTYYIKINTTGNYNYPFDLIVRCVPTPTNDLPCGAIELSCGDTLQEESMEGSTISDQIQCIGDNYHTGELWYKFHSNGENYFTIAEDSEYQISTSLYSGESCGDLTLLEDCNYSYSYTITEAGTYYFHVQTYEDELDFEFEVSLSCIPIPVNNTICGALELTCGDTLSNQTYDDLTLSMDDECNPEDDEEDIWYKFEVDGTQTHNVRVPGGNRYISLFEGNTCNSVTQVRDCTVSQGFAIGEQGTYYLRVRNNSISEPDPFSVIINCYPEPSNNVPCGANELSCGQTLSDVSFDGSTYTLLDNCDIDGKGSLWYTFVISDSETYYLDGELLNEILYLYEGDTCSDLTLIQNTCDTDDPELAISEQGTYFLKVAQESFYDSTFDLTLTCESTPANNQVCSATDISCGESIQEESFEGTTLSSVEVGSCYDNLQSDLWYRFESNGNTSYQMETSVPDNIEVVLYTGQECEEVQFEDDCWSLLSFFQIEEAGTYYLRVLNTSELNYEFDLSLNCIPTPSNDLRCNATELPCGTVLEDETTEGASVSELSSYCEDDDNGDVWYSIQVEDGITSEIDVTNNFELHVAVYEDTADCEEPVFLAGYCLPEDAPIQVTGQGDYLLKVRPSNSLDPDFDISHQCNQTPDNDQVCDAEVINCGDTLINQSFVGSTLTFEDECDGDGYGDLWYILEADGQNAYLIEETTGADVAVNLFEGPFCQSANYPMGSCLEGYDQFTVYEAGTYFYRIRPLTSDVEQVDVALRCLPPAENDEVCDAIEMTCGDTLSNISYMGATPTENQECISTDDVWFKFETEEEGQYLIEEISGSSDVIELYEGNECDLSSLTSLGCYSNPETIIITEEGKYYLRVANPNFVPANSLELTFNCIVTPENNEPCQPTPISCGDTLIDQNIVGADFSAHEGCWNSGYGDIWYTFDAYPGTTYYLEDLTGAEVKVLVYSGDCSLVEFEPCSYGDPVPLEFNEAQEVLIGVRSFTSDTFIDLALNCEGYDCPPLQANIGDNCDDGYPETDNEIVTDDCVCADESGVQNNAPCIATPFDSDSTMVASTENATSTIGSPSCGNDATSDMFYKFTAEPGGIYEISAGGENAAAVIAAYSGQCNEELTEIACASATEISEEVQIEVMLESGGQVLIQLLDWSSAGGDITINLAQTGTSTTPAIMHGSDLDLEVFPNPTRGIINIRYSLPSQADISFKLYNSSGLKVDSPTPRISRPQGDYLQVLDASHLPGGLYFLKLTTGRGTSVIRKFVVSR